ncbi:MAG: DUF6617 family protein [Lentimicrobiaceae bacterium]|jgi:hypothetical protein
MEVKILDSILHGSLKPWKIDTTNSRRFIGLVKAAKATTPTTNAELVKQLMELLSDFPAVKKLLIDEPKNPSTLQPLLFDIVLPRYKDAITNFYYLVITRETLRSYNTFLNQSASWTDLIDIRYQVGKTLTNVRVLAKQTGIELIEQGYLTAPDSQSEVTHFALYYLKNSLIQLYFSLQEHFKNSLESTISLEDFYLLDLEESILNMIELKPAAKSTESGAGVEIPDQDRIWFGFRDDFTKLATVVKQLCYQIELLNEDVSSPEDLLKAFTSENLTPGCTKIQLGCETKHFRYCLDKFKPYFHNLTLSNIEKSNIFYSKQDILITANNLSASGSRNRLEPKEKSTIDKIFKQMQQ